MPLKPTAIPASSGAVPAASDVIRITCAGAAQMRIVESTTHTTGNPRSWASAPMLM
jgi:hypothetical protein